MFDRAPKKASTVILLRPSDGGKMEVLMTRRPRAMRWLGGFYVFPGGAVEGADSSRATAGRCRGLSPQEAQLLLGKQIEPALALGHWVAAAREVFEEVGVLFCVRESGEPLDWHGGTITGRLAEKRKSLLKGEINFSGLLESEDLFCDLGAMAYFFHRITPEFSPVRFDARFFLARLPPGQSPLAVSEEVAKSLWISPAEAMSRFREGSMPMIPPTVTALEYLARLGSWANLCSQFPRIEKGPADQAGL